LYEENHKDYDQFAYLVREQLRPTNILEEIWVRNYTYSYWEAQRLSRFKQKLFYTAVEDSVARVISPFLHHNTLKVRLLARGWASRTPIALAEVEKLLGDAGLDREAIYAQILADKLDVIERIDSMIFRWEQRRNAALHDLERWRQGVAERLHQDDTFLPQLPRGAQIDPDRAS
jgi:CO/xanthine dehydrogenase FAD-binding subunit